MSTLRSIVLTALPKVALSRLCGLATRLPLPRSLRPSLYGWFARRYRADLAEVDGPVDQFASFATFFRRPLRAGARPIAPSGLVSPCDGKVVTAGPIRGDRIEQVKGRDYSLTDLLGDADLAARIAGGSQLTVYLAPGDYHRVHAPFAARLARVTALPGTLFPVNPPAVACIRDLFARNSRHVFACTLEDGRAAAVVLVGAYNVGDTLVTKHDGEFRAGDELGQFGFGSTVVVAIGPGGLAWPELAPERRLRMGESIA
ncbi:MAG: hypothetical protein RL398_3543 [Planctomycetota bacterium]|jgi:phosphatidylserine decarboxylase